MRISSFQHVAAAAVLTIILSASASAMEKQAVEICIEDQECTTESRSVPEPGVAGLLGIGLLGLIAARRRRRS